MGREKLKKEDGGIEALRLTAAQVSVIAHLQEGYELRDSLYIGASHFALHQEGCPPVPIKKATMDNLLPRGFVEPFRRENNIVYYRLTPKGEEVNVPEGHQVRQPA